VLFESQSGENQGAFTDENLIKLASQLNLDVDEFTECLTSDKYKELVQSESDFGRQIGVQSTPSFLVNTVPVVGAQPFESFKTAIESELSRNP
jgi:predicted DsbA family dithiol-disulfide isomerase